LATTTEPRPLQANDPAPRPAAPSRRRRRWPIAIFLVITMLASLGVAAGSAYGIFLYKKADNTLRRWQQPRDGGPGGGVLPTPIPTGVVTGDCEETCTYMVLGSDSRAGLSKEQQELWGSPDDPRVAGRRSDTILVMRLDPRQQKAIVLSFPRDLWVRVPGHGMGKITSAFEDGPYRTAEVIRNLTGIKVDHFIVVNLAGFQHVVEAIGGVPICIDRPLIDTEFTGLNLPHAGCYNLDPVQALAFVRARHVECESGPPDFNRIARQQQFLRAVLVRSLQPSMVVRAEAIISAVLSNIFVDPKLADKGLPELMYLVKKLQGINTGAVDFRSVPGNPFATVETPEGTKDVVTLLPEAKELFKRIRQGKPLGSLGLSGQNSPPSPAVVRVGVVDSASNGIAQRVYDYLKESAFDIQPLTTSNPYGVSGPTILFARSPQGKAAADVVHGFLGSVPEQPAPPGTMNGLDVAVVVPSTYGGQPISSPAPPGSGGGTSSCG